MVKFMLYLGLIECHGRSTSDIVTMQCEHELRVMISNSVILHLNVR